MHLRICSTLRIIRTFTQNVKRLHKLFTRENGRRKRPSAMADGRRKLLESQVLVAVDLVVVLEQDALHDGGELHVQIPEVDNKRDRKCAQCTERHAQQGNEINIKQIEAR